METVDASTPGSDCASGNNGITATEEQTNSKKAGYMNLETAGKKYVIGAVDISTPGLDHASGDNGTTKLMEAKDQHINLEMQDEKMS